MGIKNAPQIGEALNVLTHYFNNFFVLAETFGHKKRIKIKSWGLGKKFG